MIESVEEILKDSVSVGKIVSSQGLLGNVKVKIFTNHFDIFQKGKTYFLFNKERKRHFVMELDFLSRNGNRLTAHFNGCKDIEDARKLADFEIYINLNELPELTEGQYYFYQIFDCEVFDEDGASIGMVKDIIETGSADVISVFPVETGKDSEPEKEILIPLASEFIKRLDLKEKVIEVFYSKIKGKSTKEEK